RVSIRCANGTEGIRCANSKPAPRVCGKALRAFPEFTLRVNSDFRCAPIRNGMMPGALRAPDGRPLRSRPTGYAGQQHEAARGCITP
ncbi:hypothetical protein, partial [Streptomyces olivaceus]|uniref:hypothetical protein n=1 Tax=Streptomyces olivaceus TaxID=47716 RepID=UPI0036337862